jgi:hypothetical protein
MFLTCRDHLTLLSVSPRPIQVHSSCVLEAIFDADDNPFLRLRFAVGNVGSWLSVR